MNRFYCTVCNKMKRVQHYPSNVVNVDSDSPSLRRGECAWHSDPQYFTRARKVKAPKYVPAAIPVKVASGKRGR
jgi:hypothetical protein